MFRADFLPFASKIVEHSRHLPIMLGFTPFTQQTKQNPRLAVFDKSGIPNQALP
ncbi:hypothetical protein Krac_7704 [Ktedonobacter racemifer DSM 44963]|uniref:Uncharacterized protein n=1 Tax=Ktedonobacter racemifer DSM 44963 TaxID=485913 RepID=D6TKV6_KTERA|nr:hypothetical protein Krac_7704 [Ktedonobacter racemifer DSM 44963]